VVLQFGGAMIRSGILLRHITAISLATAASSVHAEDKPFYNLVANTADHKEFRFDALQGKVVMIVNGASLCGQTKQYRGLEDLYLKYNDRGFVILAFPCNQFGGQEPGSEEEIVGACKRNYGVTFPIMEKVNVNGDTTHPVYVFLKAQKSGPLGISRIKWNFEKFLVDRNGNVIERYSTFTSPEAIEADILRLL
jgi:glutathione peroxidase